MQTALRKIWLMLGIGLVFASLGVQAQVVDSPKAQRAPVLQGNNAPKLVSSDEDAARKNLLDRVNKVLRGKPGAKPAVNDTPIDEKAANLKVLHNMQNEAFSKVVENMFPMAPDQIHELRRHFNATQRAGAFTEDTPPEPTSSSLLVNLSPGSTPPVIRLSAGFVSSLVFLDSTGAPWPIKAYDIGNPAAFNVQWNQGNAQEPNKDSMSNTLLIQAVSLYKQGNLAVVLRGLNTPIMLTLIPGQKAVDYRVDVQVPRVGPNARPLIGGLPSTANPQLLDILNNITPPNGKRLRVHGGEATAWRVGGHLFVRTPMTIVSPSWRSTMSSADNVIHAYDLPPTTVLLALQNGRMQKLTVEGF